MKYLVDETQNNQRLDVIVVTAMPLLSRAFAQKLCNEGKVTVDDQAHKAGYRVKTSQIVQIDYNIEDITTQSPAIDIPIIYEDDDCVVMDKPAGMLTHTQSKFNNEPSVASFLRAKVAGLEGERAGVVHRLDRATSGVIIGAKNPAALSFLQKQFAQRKTKKIYIAIVKGHFKQPEAIIDMPIERNPKAPATFRIGSRGKPAQTHYNVLMTGTSNTLVELRPETGRTHQLRVHLAHIGHPIIGDPLYGGGKHGDRLFLHAASLELTLPNRERRVFTSPVPDIFDKKAKE